MEFVFWPLPISQGATPAVAQIMDNPGNLGGSRESTSNLETAIQLSMRVVISTDLFFRLKKFFIVSVPNISAFQIKGSINRKLNFTTTQTDG